MTRLNRRTFLVRCIAVAGAGAAGLTAACTTATPPAVKPTAAPTPATSASAPAPTAASAAPTVQAPAATAQQAPAVTPTSNTLVVGQGFDITGLGFVGRVDTEATHVAQAGLVIRDTEKYQTIPWMAEEVPSMARGTWKVNPDGTTESTYHLRSGVQWHDGTPLTAADFVFGWQLVADPKIKLTNGASATSQVGAIDTPDDRTVVFKWKGKYPGADSVFDTALPPLPRHLLQESYQAGRYDEINTSPYWNKSFVHAGPFKVVDFVPGSHVEFAAFDDFFMGRPKIDRIIWRIIPDSNAVLAAVLANEVDVTTRAALTVENGIVADRDWASKGQGTVKFSPVNWTWLGPSASSPICGWNAPNQNLVRQAMLHAIDRQAIVETLFAGKEQVLDFPLSPVRPAFAAATAAVTKYPYDPARAQQLLDQAGWRKGSDGIRTNDSGERFVVDFTTTAGQKDAEAMQAAIAANLKAVGIETRIQNFPDRVINDKDHRNHWPGLHLAQHNIEVEDWRRRFHSSNTPNDANEWLPLNQSGWQNPRKDEIIDLLEKTLDADQRSALIVEWLKLFGDDLPMLPIKYNAEVTSYRKVVKNVPIRQESGGDNFRTWNVHLWEKTA